MNPTRRTNQIAALSLLVIYAGGGCISLSIDGGSTSRHIPTYSASTFYETTSVYGASFSPDESNVLITSDATGVYNAYRQSIGGGKPEMLTDSTTNATSGVGYFPHDGRILFTSDQGGNENNHLFVRELDGTKRE